MKHDFYEAPESQGAATPGELISYAARTRGVFVFVMLGIIGGIAGREHYGWWQGIAIAGVCIVVASLLSLSGPEMEHCEK